jgi:hypothetical protein
MARHDAAFTAEDLAILGQVDSSIAIGRELKAWWTANRDTRVRLASVPIARQIHEPDSNYGFVMDAHLRSGTLPVAGVVQDQEFRWPKMPPGRPRDPQWMRAQLRTFVLEYFMRMAGTQPRLRAEPVRSGDASAGSRSVDRLGWGYRQKYYKLAATGEIGKFPAGQQALIVPLHEVGAKYSWIVFQVNIYHFDMSLGVPGASNGPSLNLSMTQPVHTVMTPDFVVDEENPAPGIVGEYGYGYSVVPNPTLHPMVTDGPSAISKTIEMLTFRVLESGAVRAHMDLITPQPARIVNIDPVQLAFDVADRLSLNMASTLLAPLKALLQGLEPQVDPIYLFINILNGLTAGIASEEFGISKQTLFTTFMSLHFTDVFKMYNLAASHFAMVRDWTDAAALPAWATTGAYTPPGAP